MGGARLGKEESGEEKKGGRGRVDQVKREGSKKNRILLRKGWRRKRERIKRVESKVVTEKLVVKVAEQRELGRNGVLNGGESVAGEGREAR